MKEGWNVIIKYAPEWKSTNVWLVNKSGNQETVVNPIDLTMTTTLSPGDIPPEPTLHFTGNDAAQFLQELTDGLVEVGFKSDAVKVSDERLLAVQAHLEDMRTLVFKALMPPSLPKKNGVEK